VLQPAMTNIKSNKSSFGFMFSIILQRYEGTKVIIDFGKLKCSKLLL
jgi:hypothetical protein